MPGRGPQHDRGAMFVSHHADAEMFVHRDRLLADAEEFRLARLARAARRRRRREAAVRDPVPPVADPGARPVANTGEKRRSPVRA
ncbi:hypothetical protein PSU4_10070 [Pseudonocardia sulfidoxydans NBRC 16205]|uniref:Uncharacterized protein n=3 Tax=Pseudonocardia sulfidoxydans TaxID=54011 RepID=A0A511DCC5_9PSEU|nr:hypothetical protein PSU4_10070 [Pseudonocardia sulfidoxydans NBRC 16205]